MGKSIQYIYVYIQKPGREGLATELLTYMAEDQSIAEEALDWAMYDEQYTRIFQGAIFLGDCERNAS